MVSRERPVLNLVWQWIVRGLDKHRVGGISLLWQWGINLSFTFYSLNNIQSSCVDDENGENWFMSGIYGHPKD